MGTINEAILRRLDPEAADAFAATGELPTDRLSPDPAAVEDMTVAPPAPAVPAPLVPDAPVVSEAPQTLNERLVAMGLPAYEPPAPSSAPAAPEQSDIDYALLQQGANRIGAAFSGIKPSTAGPDAIRARRKETMDAYEAKKADVATQNKAALGAYDAQYGAVRKALEAKAKAASGGLTPYQLKNLDLRQQGVTTQEEIRKEKKEEKREQRRILDSKGNTIGYARTPNDVKSLTSAVEQKFKFDQTLDEMISLRQKHDGGALLNREDVDRGKQLSNDLLLIYKDLAKLGVLSVADEKILRSIIPEDPLAFHWSGIAGQDPILHKMTKWKGDINSEYNTKLNTRLRPEEATEAPKSKNQDAIQWAKDNPDDPRAARILKHNQQ